MRNRHPLLALAFALVIVGTAAGQSPSSALYSTAVPPDKEVLERLNLYNEWSTYVPLGGRADGLAEIQIVEGGQIFAQTRAGLLVAVDAVTGTKQWTFRYPRPYSNVYPVGITDKFVFAVNVGQLYCLHRYTGLLEFSFELPGAASAGPVADKWNVYVTLGTTKTTCYRYPQLLRVDPDLALTIDPDSDLAGGPGVAAGGQVLRGGTKGASLSDQIADRYNSRFSPKAFDEPEFEATRFSPSYSVTGDDFGGSNQVSPSMTMLPRVTPPYGLHQYVTTPSLSVLPTLRQPYQSRPSFMLYNQRTPSISALPPSVARAAELSNLRPRPVEPTLVWELLTSRRVIFQPILTEPQDGSLASPQVWYTTAGNMIYSVLKRDRTVQVVIRATGMPAAPGAGPVAYGKEQMLGFFSLDDGTLLGVDLTAGNTETPAIHFRAHVGGRLNHKAVPTRFGGVYASGDNSGIARVDIENGDITWRTDRGADRLLAVNEEFAYVMNDRNELLVYDARRVNDPATRRATPLAKMAATGYDVPITNDLTDRVLLGSNNGLLVCLRSASPKYAKPMVVAPSSKPAPPPKPADGAIPQPVPGL